MADKYPAKPTVNRLYFLINGFIKSINLFTNLLNVLKLLVDSWEKPSDPDQFKYEIQLQLISLPVLGTVNLDLTGDYLNLPTSIFCNTKIILLPYLQLPDGRSVGISIKI